MQHRKCSTIVDGKECGLELEQENPESDSILTQYRCALGHRTHIVAEKKPAHPPGGRLRDRHKAS